MISDDDLILYHYRELDAAERARIGAAISAQPALAQRMHELGVWVEATTPLIPGTSAEDAQLEAIAGFLA